MKVLLERRLVHKIPCPLPKAVFEVVSQAGKYVEIGPWLLDTGSDFTTLPFHIADRIPIRYDETRPLGFAARPGIAAYLNSCSARLSGHEFALPIVVTKPIGAGVAAIDLPPPVIGRAGIIEHFDLQITSTHLYIRMPWRIFPQG